MASINRNWREFAIPLFCQTIAVDFNSTAYKERARSDKGVSTNLGLIHSVSQQMDIVHNLQIGVRGARLSAYQLYHKLKSIEFDMVWPRIERLSIVEGDRTRRSTVISGFNKAGPPDKLNELLALCLPSLREISIGIKDPTAVAWLINDFLHWETPMRALRLTCLTSLAALASYKSPRNAPPPAPIEITCLSMDPILYGDSLHLHPILASSLVELTLGPVRLERIWDPFVTASGDTGGDDLVFSSLRSLSLGVYGADYTTWDDEDEDDELNTNAMPTTRPLFPVLTQLSISQLPGNVNRFLSIFND
ncbi:hypothetical protein IWW38_005109, partial [Coemansia aciculifera]